MSATDDRVACPACGARFSVPVDAVPAGGHGPSARCRRCEAPFRVENDGRTLRAVSVEAPVKPSQADPTPPVRLPTSVPTGNGGGRTTGATPLPPGAFHEGDRIGRYEVEAVLGRGGMGTVYKAYDPAGNRHVALKVLLKEATELDRMRFQREIQVQGNVQHPNIMPILDSGSVGAQRYYVMELLNDPIDLLHLVQMLSSGELQVDPKLRPLARIERLIERVVLPICQAVFHANANEGVLHRDIKPANVILDRKGLRPLLIDFGVSSILEKKNARLAHLDRELPIPLKGDGVRVTGTLVFMPPEQARGEADRRGDVWALGALLHYIVAGEPPFQPASRPIASRRERIQGLEMLIDMARADGRIREISEFEAKLAEVRSGGERTVDDLQREVLAARYRPRPPGLDRSLDAIIERSMAKRPGDRYRHAMEFHDDLEAWLAAKPVKARMGGTAAGSLWYRLRLLVMRQRVAIALLLVGLAVVGFVVTRDADVGPDLTVQSLALVDEAGSKIEAGAYGDAHDLLREAIALAPENDQAFEQLEHLRRRQAFDTDLERARILRLEAREAYQDGRAGDALDRIARLGEIVEGRLLPPQPGASEALVSELAALRAFARDEQPLTVVDVPAGATVQLLRVDGARGRIDWDTPLEAASARLVADAVDPLRVASGHYLVRVRNEKRAVFLPIVVLPGRSGASVTCPLDPASLPAGMLYVGPGRVRGPLGEVDVGALLFDREEVTCARYARFLDSLTPEERRRRVPREAGVLGALGRPIWDAVDDGFRPPSGSVGKPVEDISAHDARAFARFEGKRLPTVAEWAWAATGPDGRVCPIGPAEALWTGAANLGDESKGVAGVRALPHDRSPFGLYGMAGNVAEFTRTLETVRGVTGWLVMGGSYLTDPSRALVTTTRPLPGWLPTPGVGFRCVRRP